MFSQLVIAMRNISWNYRDEIGRMFAATRLGGDWGCVGVMKRATEVRGTRLAYRFPMPANVMSAVRVRLSGSSQQHVSQHNKTVNGF